MKHRNHKQLLKQICAALLAAALCMGLAAGCSRSDPAQTQAAAPQTTEPAPLTTEPAPMDTTESVPHTTEPAPADTTEPVVGCDALFYGDSITKGNNFDEFFPQLRIVDYGINGATIEDLTERVPKLSAYRPKKIFVMAGGNNLESHNEAECVELFRGLLDALREACPDAEIYVEGMLPLDKFVAMRCDCPNRVIRTFNAHLAELAEEYGMTYLDTYSVYEYQGGLNSEMTDDGVHLKYDCFGPWAEVIRPYLEP